MDRHSSTKGSDKDKDGDLTKEPVLINSSNSVYNPNGLLYISNRPIRFRTGFRNTIFDAMKKRNWKWEMRSWKQKSRKKREKNQNQNNSILIIGNFPTI